VLLLDVEETCSVWTVKYRIMKVEVNFTFLILMDSRILMDFGWQNTGLKSNQDKDDTA